MIKALIPALVIASAVAAPNFAFAQSNGPVTRAQVKAELAQLEAVGYNPASDNIHYPRGIQAAEARLAAQQNATSSSYGGVTAGSTASGHIATAKDIYAGS
jgi:hypothetical protein